MRQLDIQGCVVLGAEVGLAVCGWMLWVERERVGWRHACAGTPGTAFPGDEAGWEGYYGLGTYFACQYAEQKEGVRGRGMGG